MINLAGAGGGRALADPRHGWVWTVLPETARRVEVLGDPDLAELLRRTGLDVVADGEYEAPHAGSPPPDAILVTARRHPPRALASRVARLRDGGVVATALERPGGSPDRPPPSVASRAGRLTAAAARALLTAASAARLAESLRSAGLEVRRIAASDRARAHRLVGGARGRLPSASVIVVGARGSVRTILDRARLEAASAIDASPEPRRCAVLGSGTVMVELGGEGEGAYLLRVAGGPARSMLERSAERVRTIRGASPPAALGERLVAPLAEGDLGPAGWAVEPKVEGAPPRRMTAGLWEECIDFLVALHGLRTGDQSAGPSHAAVDVEDVAPQLDDAARATLVRVGPALEDRVGDLPRGWGHRDFWPRNLLARGDRLVAVLDWDAADPGCLPALDLLHLISLSNRPTRRLSHGARCVRWLWPLARAGGDRNLSSYCQGAGIPADGRVLEGLAVAYWLARIARDLRTFADRPGREGWMEENVRRPLAALRASGW